MTCGSSVAWSLLTLVALAGPARAFGLHIITETPSPFAAALPTDPRYIIGLHDEWGTAKQPKKELVQQSYKVMTRENGQRYRCYTPPRSALQEAQQASHASMEISKSPFELLDGLTALCLYRQEGLWTYEMCYKKGTRQFRQDGAGNRHEDFSCGKYTGDEAQSEEIKYDASSASIPLKYVSHNMSGGAECVMTGQGRTTEVRFTCMRDVTDNIIVSVKEFPTCNYVFTVATPFLCKHPEFKPPPDDIRSLTCVRETEQDRQEQLKQQQQQQQQAGGVVAPSAAPTQQVPTTSTSVEQTAPPSSSQVPAAQQPGGEQQHQDVASLLQAAVMRVQAIRTAVNAEQAAEYAAHSQAESDQAAARAHAEAAEAMMKEAERVKHRLLEHEAHMEAQLAQIRKPPSNALGQASGSQQQQPQQQQVHVPEHIKQRQLHPQDSVQPQHQQAVQQPKQEAQQQVPSQQPQGGATDTQSDPGLQTNLHEKGSTEGKQAEEAQLEAPSNGHADEGAEGEQALEQTLDPLEKEIHSQTDKATDIHEPQQVDHTEL